MTGHTVWAGIDYDGLAYFFETDLDDWEDRIIPTPMAVAWSGPYGGYGGDVLCYWTCNMTATFRLTWTGGGEPPGQVKVLVRVLGACAAEAYADEWDDPPEVPHTGTASSSAVITSSLGETWLTAQAGEGHVEDCPDPVEFKRGELRTLTVTNGVAQTAVNVGHQMYAEENHGFAAAEAPIVADVQLVPLAVAYDFTGYPNPPPAGTTPFATETRAALQQPGPDATCYDADAYTNQTPQHAVEKMKQAAIFTAFGHGGGNAGAERWSLMTFWAPWTDQSTNPPTTTNQYYYMVQKEDGKLLLMNRKGIPADRIVVLDEQPADAFKKMLLAAFIGCFTGNAGMTHWGAPTQGVVDKGALAALGFESTIFPHDPGYPQPGTRPGAEEWAETFWRALCRGESVGEAIAAARKAVGDMARPRGLLSVQTTGAPGTDPKALRIYPARYNAQGE